MGNFLLKAQRLHKFNLGYTGESGELVLVPLTSHLNLATLHPLLCAPSQLCSRALYLLVLMGLRHSEDPLAAYRSYILTFI